MIFEPDTWYHSRVSADGYTPWHKLETSQQWAQAEPGPDWIKT